VSIVSVGATDWEKPAQRAAYSISETAELLGLCEASVYRALKRGDLASVLIGGRRVIPKTSLDRLLTPNAA
jgi:excisionase family DNA binding protein